MKNQERGQLLLIEPIDEIQPREDFKTDFRHFHF